MQSSKLRRISGCGDKTKINQHKELTMSRKAPVRTTMKKTPDSIPPDTSARRTYSNGYLPLQDEDLKRILACSASPEQADKAMRKFQKSRADTDAWRRTEYNATRDRWLTRLRRYLRFFQHRKTASGWPITPFKFIAWAKHDPRPTMRSIRTYLDTIEVARAVTHALFVPEFPEIVNHSTLLNHPEVMKLLNELEISLAHTLVPQNRPTNLRITPIASSSSNPTTTANPTATTMARTITATSTRISKTRQSTKQKQIEHEPRKRRKVSTDSSNSGQPLWDLPLPSITNNISEISSSSRRKKNKQDEGLKSQSHRRSFASNSSVELQDPFLKRLRRFSDLKALLLQESFFNTFRLYHPNVRSVQQEIEQLEDDIEDLTSSQGELSQIASKEVLTICLQSYLEFWTNKEISGFPIQAIKLCVWFDSISVTRKEAIDIAIGLERLGNRVEDQIDDHHPILFESSGPLMQSKLWISFLDHFGWGTKQDEWKEPDHDGEDDNNNLDVREEDVDEDQVKDMELASSDSPPPHLSESIPLHDHHHHHQSRSPNLCHQMSISSISSSLSSLPHSPSPLLTRLENSLESECIPDQSDLDPHKTTPLETSHEEENNSGKKNKHNDASENEHDQPQEQEQQDDDEHLPYHNHTEPDHHHQQQQQKDDDELNEKDGYYNNKEITITQLSYRRDRLNSPKHQQFLSNLRRFIQLF